MLRETQLCTKCYREFLSWQMLGGICSECREGEEKNNKISPPLTQKTKIIPPQSCVKCNTLFFQSEVLDGVCPKCRALELKKITKKEPL